MTDILTINQVKKHFTSCKDKKVVVTGGCFDLLHIGHIHLLENAKKQGDILVVFLESDEDIKKRKGINRPIHTQKQRAEMLRSISAVDVIILLKPHMQNEDYDQLIDDIRPFIIATTENDTSLIHKKRQAEHVGAKVVAVNKYIPAVSTTKLLSILEKEL